VNVGTGEPSEVERFRLATRVLHWRHTAAFLMLAIIGLFLFVLASLAFVREALTWGRHDLAWLRAAPAYHLGDPKAKES